MFKILLISVTLFASCANSKSKQLSSNSLTIDTTYQNITHSFLINLYEGNENQVLSFFDSIVHNAYENGQLGIIFQEISSKIRNEFERPINSTVVLSEKTIHENLPATFVVVKIESLKKFGYYFYYINDKTGKIILFSEFAKIKEKRTS